MKENWRQCVDHILASEGGFVNHERDPGGATNMGITIGTLSSWLGRQATVDEVRSLSRETAESIYRAEYWNAVQGDDLPAGLDLVAFDAAVNSGYVRGALWLQRALEVKADGIIGPKTLAAARAAAADLIINRACHYRLTWLRGLSTWATFGKGWESRVAKVRTKAQAMASLAPRGMEARMTTLEDRVSRLESLIEG